MLVKLWWILVGIISGGVFFVWKGYVIGSGGVFV